MKEQERFARENILENPKIFAEQEEPDPEEKPMAVNKEYRGFLHIKCRHCGKENAFCAKNPLSVFHCKHCNGVTELENLKPLYIHCECGKQSKYMTNMDTKMFDANCFNCGNSVAVAYNEKKHVYETVQ